jgi:hypothetical protein
MRYLFSIVASFGFAVFATSATAAQSLHEMPPGTTVEGSFMLAGKLVPLPPGKFKLAFGGVRAAELLPGARVRSAPAERAEVVLYTTDGTTLQVVLHARANFGTRSRWSLEPCKRDNLLYRLDRANTADWIADCFTVNHQLGLLTNPGGIWVDVNDRLKAEGVQVPLQLVIEATFTRMYHEDLLISSYYINPVAYGLAADRGANWATSPWNKIRIDNDPAKAAFVGGVILWGNRMLPAIGEGFEGKNPVAAGTKDLDMALPRK